MTTVLNWQQRGIAYETAVVSGHVLQAASAISPNRALEIDSSGTVAHATADTLKFVGVSPERSYSAADLLTVVVDGLTPCEVNLPVIAGQFLKCGAAGQLIQLVDDALDAVTMHSVAAGGNFANQPSNDAVTVVSDSASDTQTCTIYGTTTGTDTVVVETITLTGVTPVTTTKVNWGQVLGIELGSAAVGTITVKEDSGSLTIITLSATDTSSGVESVTAGTTQYAYNRTISAVAGGASTKQIGFVGTDSTGAVQYDSQALNGATAVLSNSAFQTVTKVLIGDIATATTATVKTTATQDDKSLAVARAMENQTVAGNTCLVKLL